MTTRRRPARAIRRAVATLLTGLLVLLAAGGAVAAVTSTRIVVVATDSMRPAIRTGDVLVVPAGGGEAVAAGDIVAYRGTSGKAWVVHRVVETRTVDGARYLVTKGDANPQADQDLVPAGNVHGTACCRVPWLGHLLAGLTTATTRLVLGGVIAVVIVRELVVVVRTWRRIRARSRATSCARPAGSR